MRFLAILLLIVVSVFFDTTQAAGCYSDPSRGRCLSRRRLRTAVNGYCTNNWDKEGQSWRRWNERDNSGAHGYLGHIGTFKSKNDCVSLGNSIVNKCKGRRRKGGAAARGGAAINVLFCPW